MFSGKSTNPTDYNGPREAKGIVSAALKEVNSLVNARLGGKASGGGSKSKSSNGDKKESKKNNKGGNKDAVIHLKDSDFDELVLQSDDVWMVEFYGMMCLTLCSPVSNCTPSSLVWALQEPRTPLESCCR